MIDPLLSTTLSLPRPAQAAGDKSADRASFEALLARLATEGGAPVKGEEVAAEVLRLEMMQSSLALAGENAPSEPVTSPTMAAVMKGLARFAEQAPKDDIPPLLARTAQDPPAAAADTGAITRTAAQFLGTPYLFGGETTNGIDCSSFVQHVFREHNVNLPRTAREQIKMGTEVAPGDLKEGDLVFFQTYASYPSHVGIYLGNGKMMHASSRHGEVTISDMNTNYFRSRYLGARRVA